MPTELGQLVRRLQSELVRDGAAVTDSQLLERFLSAHDGDAFAVLVQRHGPMVLGVCRRVLANPHDAEDAFQATFLVAVRKAAAVRPRELFGNWLYGVAYRTALEARTRISRRRAKEKQVEDMHEPQLVEPEAPWQELRPLLDRELARLPDKYRVPIVLCDLEGHSRREVALQLRLPEGTLSSRLATARKTLARRLSRHGLALSGGALATLVAGNASAGPPRGLVRSTVKAAALLGRGQAVVATTVSPHVTALTEGVLQAMFLTKLRVASLFVLALAVLVTGAALACYQALAADQAEARRTGQPDQAASHEDNSKAPGKIRPDDDKAEVIRGSGKEVNREMKLSGFTSVDIGSVFHVEITRAASFRVAITADDNVIPYVQATLDGSTLKIRLDSKHRSFQNVTLKAAVAMPSIEGLSLSGASRATIEGFRSGKDFKLCTSGASALTGDIGAGNADLEVSGASHVTLNGSAAKARLSATGASRLTLGEFAVNSANVILGGASQATIHVKTELDYDLTGASRLSYRGKPTIGKKRATGASSVSSK